jgi:4-amino-4-deoxy-L-arabinose transferase-like glycosyltransferase
MQTFSAFKVVDRLDNAIDWLTASHRRAALALLAIALVTLLPGFVSLPVTNRDESRFAQPAKEMIETGDYIDIQLQGDSRYRKPIGIYWLQSSAVRLAEAVGFANAREHIAFYRLPSLMAVIGSVLLTYWAALAFMARRYAFLAALALGTAIMVGVEARIATIDASLMLTGVAAQGALARFYLGRAMPVGPPAREWGFAAMFWTAIAGAILLKGPVLPLVVLLTAVSLAIADRSGRWLLRLKPAAGLAWVLLLVLPWFVAIYLRSEGEFYQHSVGTDFLGRLLEPAEGHWGPPGYFWLLFWICFWPASALAPMATGFAWAQRRDPFVRFLIAWIVPGWIMFELVITKLPHYVLPLYPGFAVMIALAIARKAELETWTRGTAFLWPVVAIFLPIVCVVLAFRFNGTFGVLFWPAAAVAILFGVFAWGRVLAGAAERGLILALIAGIATAVAAYSVLPRIKGFDIAGQLVQAARAAPCPNPKLVSSGYSEPNLIFLGGTNTEFTGGAGAAEFLRLGGCRVAFVESRQQRAFADHAAAIGLVAVRIGQVDGFSYSNWRSLSFLVLLSKEGN